MNPARLQQDLIRYRGSSPRQESSTVETLAAFVERSANPFSRKTAEGHITASAWILNTAKSHALLCHHRKLDMWVQLGGHLEPGDDSVFAGAMREAYEESGLVKIEPLSDQIFDVDVHQIPAFGDEPAHLHYDVRFIFAAVDSDEWTLSSESKELAWLRLNEIGRVSTESSLLRMANKASRFMKM